MKLWTDLTKKKNKNMVTEVSYLVEFWKGFFFCPKFSEGENIFN